jgi:hypothetical protein
MDPATDQQQQGVKRVRFTGSNKDTAAKQPSKGPSPIAVAKLTANILIVSLPPVIQPLAIHFSSKFIEFRTELVRLHSTKLRLADEDFTPISARIKFELGVSDRVKENAAAEFGSLVQRNELSLAAFRDELKSQISEALELEIKVMRAEISTSFCSAVGMVSIALGLHRNLTTTQVRTLALHTIERNHEQLFKWTESTPESFGKTFKTATEDVLPAHVFGTLDKEDITAVQSHSASLLTTLEGIFVRPWDDYMKATQENERQLLLKQFVDMQLKETATSNAAMDLEDEELTQVAVKDLIAAQVTKSTRSIQGKLDRLTKQLQSEKTRANKANTPRTTETPSTSLKNQPRGANRVSASSPNQKGSKQARTNAQKAAAAGNASTNGRRTKTSMRANKNRTNSQRNSQE